MMEHLGHRRRALLACIAAATALLAGTQPANAAAAVAIAGPGSFQTGYHTPAVVTVQGGPIELVSVDLQPHNFVALGHYGSDDYHWCAALPEGKCPLFWSPLIINDVVAVEGLDQTPPGIYDFYCSVHANRMVGTLVVV